MRKRIIAIALFIMSGVFLYNAFAQTMTLRNSLKDKFLMGVSVNVRQTENVESRESQVIAKQFSSVTPENCMKSMVIHPERNCFNFTDADAYVDFGTSNKQFVIGHCLIWHSQLAPWFCIDDNGNNVSADTLKARMKTHIQTIVSRYKGRIKGWDVVNEAIEDNGEFRKSQFYHILGEDYIPLAFQFAHEADPDAELYYNDYSMAKPGRMKTVLNMVEKLKAKGIRIDGIGMQGHITMDYPTFDEYEKAIVAYGTTGCKVMITELDLTVLPNPQNITGAEVSQKAEYLEKLNPYAKGMTRKAENAWTQRMNGFFKIFLKHSNIISRVTVWGLTDSNSWRNDWPIPGRKDYPVLFDRNANPKTIVKMIINEANK